MSGFAAGAVLMVLELFWAATTTDEGPWRIPQLVAAILTAEPPAAGAPAVFSAFTVAIALVVHYALGVVFGLALGALVSWFHSFHWPNSPPMNRSFLPGCAHMKA